MKKLLFVVIGVLLGLKTHAQNQFHIGQYAIHQPFINPAAIGSMSTINFAALYKKQWTGFEGSPHLQGFNFNMPIGTKKSNFIGVNVLNDKAGLNNSTEVSGTYAYKIKTSTKSRLVFSLSASLNMVSADLSNASVIDASDPVYTGNSPVFALPNFKFGSYFYKNNFYVGFVMPNILENKVIETNGSSEGYFGFNASNMHYYLHGGYKWDFKNDNSLITSLLVKEVAGAPIQFDLNLHTMFKERFGVGVTARSSKEFMGMLSMYLLPELLLSYGYEYGITELNQFNNGTHEILLVYKINGGQEPIAFPRM